MRVFITEESPLVSARLVALMSDIDGISIMGFAHNIAQTVEVMRVMLPDIAIVGSHYPWGGTKKLLRIVRQESPKTLLIVLANQAEGLEEQYKAAGATFVFDKVKEIDVMVDIVTLMCKGGARPNQ